MRPSDFLRRLEKPHLNVTSACMPPSFEIGSILQYGEKPVIPPRVPMTATLSPFVPQHPKTAFTGGNLLMPAGGKAKSELITQLLGEQREMRYVEYLGRQPSDSEEARDKLQEIIQSKRTLKEQQELDNLMLMGLTEEEAKDVIRKQFIENALKYKGAGHLRNHQQQKEALADFARARGVIVGLPPSMAKHEGVAHPDTHFTNTEKYQQKKVLEYKLKKAQDKAEAESRERFNPDKMALYGKPFEATNEVEQPLPTVLPNKKWRKDDIRRFMRSYNIPFEDTMTNRELVGITEVWFHRNRSEPPISTATPMTPVKPIAAGGAGSAAMKTVPLSRFWGKTEK